MIYHLNLYVGLTVKIEVDFNNSFYRKENVLIKNSYKVGILDQCSIKPIKCFFVHCSDLG